MSHLSRRRRAALTAAALITTAVATAPATAAAAKLTSTYTCVYPLIGEVPLTIAYDAAIPSTVAVGAPTGAIALTSAVTSGGKTFDGFSLIGAVRLEGTVTPRGTVVAPGGGTAPWTAASPITPYDVPVSKQDVAFTAVGSIPSRSFSPAGGAGFTVNGVALSLRAIKADGNAVIFPGAAQDSDTDASTFDVVCRLDPVDQDRVLGLVGVGGPPPTTLPQPTAQAARITGLQQGTIYPNGGGEVTIRGEGLDAALSVTIDGNPVDFSARADGSLTFRAPAHPSGTAQVRVVTGDGPTADNGTADDLVYAAVPPAPQVTGVSPASGPRSGGNTVTITGRYLTGAETVVFGSALSGSVTVIDDRTITVIAPPSVQAGTVHVQVIALGGDSSNGSDPTADAYTYESDGTQPTTPGATTPDDGALTYQCTYPLIGEAPVSVKLATNLPANLPQGKPTPESDLAAEITSSGKTWDALSLIGAQQASGRAIVRSTVTFPGGIDLPVTTVAPLSEVDVSATRQPLVFSGQGPLPSLTFPTAGPGQIAIDSIILSLKAIKADGTAVVFPGADDDSDRDPSTFDVSCRLDPADQDTVLATFAVSSDGSIPSTPPATTPRGTTPVVTPIPSTPTPLPTTPPVATTPTDGTKPSVTIGAVTQSPRVNYQSTLTVAFLVSEPSKVSATLSRHEFGVRSGRNCIEPPKGTTTIPAATRCVRLVWANPPATGWFRSGAGALTFPKAPKKGWWTLALTAKDAAGNTGGATRYILLT